MAFIVNPKQINPGKYETFDALFSIPDGVTQGSTDLCQINIEGATTDAVYYKDFTIKIQ